MNRIAFFLNIEPQPPTVTHQEKKFGGVTKKGTPIFYPTPELANARSLLKSKLTPFAPPEPWNCPIQLSCQWVFLRPKSRKGKFMMNTPDTDNLQKMLKDVMSEAKFWTDDKIVVREVVEKVWKEQAEKHGIIISLIDLTQENKE